MRGRDVYTRAAECAAPHQVGERTNGWTAGAGSCQHSKQKPPRSRLPNPPVPTCCSFTGKPALPQMMITLGCTAHCTFKGKGGLGWLGRGSDGWQLGVVRHCSVSQQPGNPSLCYGRQVFPLRCALACTAL